MSDKQQPRRKEILDLPAGKMPATTIVLARRFLAEYPNDATILMLRGMAFQALRRFDEAKWDYDDALLFYEGERTFILYRQVGNLYEEKGALSEAENWYRRAIADGPDDAGNYIFLGAMFAHVGRYQEAEELYRKGIKCSAGAVEEAWLNLGLVLRAQEEYEEAYECF